MNPDLERDLTAWQDGHLSREELVGRHGGEASSLLGAHDLLIRGATMAPLDTDASWNALVSRLDEPAPVVTLARRRLRTAVLAVAAALMLAGSAIATVGPRTGDASDAIVPDPTRSVGGSLTSDPDEVVPPLVPSIRSEGEEDPEVVPPETEEPTGDTRSEDPRGDDGQDDDTEGEDPQRDQSEGDEDEGDEDEGDEDEDQSEDDEDDRDGIDDSQGDADGDASDPGSSDQDDQD